MLVRNIRIREILATNSRKTIEVELETDKGSVRSSVPMGTSTGSYEARQLTTEEVIRKFLMIRPYFTNHNFVDQKDLDFQLHAVDKTQDFRDIGGNLALAISSVFLKAFAAQAQMETFEFLADQYKLKNKTDDKSKLPKPLCNVIGGWAGTGASDIQEFLLMPVHQNSFKANILKIADAYQDIADALQKADSSFKFAKNYESAWVTSLNVEKILSLMTTIAKKNLLSIGLDVAASNLWDGDSYVYANSGLKLGRTEQISFIEDLVSRYPVSYIEDPFHEDDYIAFSTLNTRLAGKNKLVCGDDLYATNAARLSQGIAMKATNAVIIKPNQVGTITDTIKTVEEAKSHNVVCVLSHRSGETEDTLMCHLAVGLGCEYIKLGISGERTVKINEMLRIEEKLTG
jgi:enolase